MQNEPNIPLNSNMIAIGALIERWQAGDERAAQALYDHFWDRTFWLAYGLLGDPDDAEEVAQDALYYALSNIARFDPDRAAFGTWLHTITVSRSRNRYRRRLTWPSLTAWLARGGDVPDPSSSHEQKAIRIEAKSAVWEAVQSLTPRLREAILLRYWAGHTYREMADILGCPVPTAQSRVRLAFQRLQADLAPESLVDLGDVEERIMR
ncbi:MAG: sigma-70 family RNA polymerase sigma factor [Anaerolineae bacterium]|nr:sigma-70 family RNA polymerase sigma factor [Anaerolineae bacterium]